MNFFWKKIKQTHIFHDKQNYTKLHKITYLSRFLNNILTNEFFYSKNFILC